MSSEIQEVKDVWVAFTNADRTEGRGHRVPLYYSTNKTTAMRLGRGKGVQGSTDVGQRSIFRIRNTWYGPIYLTPSTREDDRIESKRLETEAAIQAARDAGLTSEQIAALRRQA